MVKYWYLNPIQDGGHYSATHTVVIPVAILSDSPKLLNWNQKHLSKKSL